MNDQDIPEKAVEAALNSFFPDDSNARASWHASFSLALAAALPEMEAAWKERALSHEALTGAARLAPAAGDVNDVRALPAYTARQAVEAALSQSHREER